MSHSINDSLSLIDEFLKPARMQAQKEASLRKRAADTSFKDTTQATPENQAKPESARTTQNNLGTEQVQNARDSGSNIDSVSPNSDADGERFWDTQGTQTLGTDDLVTEDGNIGPMREQEITQEQKTARAQHMGNAILNILYKEATGGQHAPQRTAPAQRRAPQQMQQKTAAEAFFQKAAAEAAGAAQEYFEGYYQGIIKRAHDEYEVANANIPQNLLNRCGGVRGLLDKVAMEFPEAVMPEGTEVPAAPEGEEAAEEAAEGEAIPADMTGGGEMPVFGGEGGGEGGGDPADELAAALEEAGVTPEELAQAIEDVTALQEAGIAPEELASSMEEIMATGGGEGAPAEAPVEAPVEKLASYRRGRGLSRNAQRILSILSR